MAALLLLNIFIYSQFVFICSSTDNQICGADWETVKLVLLTLKGSIHWDVSSRSMGKSRSEIFRGELWNCCLGPRLSKSVKYPGHDFGNKSLLAVSFGKVQPPLFPPSPTQWVTLQQCLGCQLRQSTGWIPRIIYTTIHVNKGFRFKNTTISL